jgi:RNA polymerase sigma-70 factor (ECF subfamily)
VLYLCGQRGDELDDGVQEVQLRLLEVATKPARRGAWACTVAANLACDQARRAGRRRNAEKRLGAVREPVADPDVALKLAVRVGLAAMPLELRAVLVLRFYADLSVPQIAEMLGEPEGTIKSRLHRAASAMREALPQERTL